MNIEQELKICEAFWTLPPELSTDEDWNTLYHFQDQAKVNYQPLLETLLAIRTLCETETGRYGGHAHEAGRASMAQDVLKLLE